jgi:hypothetical protein
LIAQKPGVHTQGVAGDSHYRTVARGIPAEKKGSTYHAIVSGQRYFGSSALFHVTNQGDNARYRKVGETDLSASLADYITQRKFDGMQMRGQARIVFGGEAR